jgi:hypothetical protein
VSTSSPRLPFFCERFALNYSAPHVALFSALPLVRRKTISYEPLKSSTLAKSGASF